MLGLYLQGGLWAFFSGVFENQSFPTDPGVSQQSSTCRDS